MLYKQPCNPFNIWSPKNCPSGSSPRPIGSTGGPMPSSQSCTPEPTKLGTTTPEDLGIPTTIWQPSVSPRTDHSAGTDYLCSFLAGHEKRKLWRVVGKRRQMQNLRVWKHTATKMLRLGEAMGHAPPRGAVPDELNTPPLARPVVRRDDALASPTEPAWDGLPATGLRADTLSKARSSSGRIVGAWW